MWAGINAVMVGNAHIGNDVLIAPNSYVNFNVPDSLFIGNLTVVKQCDRASEGYINNELEV